MPSIFLCFSVSGICGGDLNQFLKIRRLLPKLQTQIRARRKRQMLFKASLSFPNPVSPQTSQKVSGWTKLTTTEERPRNRKAIPLNRAEGEDALRKLSTSTNFLTSTRLTRPLMAWKESWCLKGEKLMPNPEFLFLCSPCSPSPVYFSPEGTFQYERLEQRAIIIGQNPFFDT